MSDNAAVFPYQSPPLGNSVSSLNWLKLREEVRHDRLSDTLQMILVDLIG